MATSAEEEVAINCDLNWSQTLCILIQFNKYIKSKNFANALSPPFTLIALDINANLNLILFFTEKTV